MKKIIPKTTRNRYFSWKTKFSWKLTRKNRSRLTILNQRAKFFTNNRQWRCKLLLVNYFSHEGLMITHQLKKKTAVEHLDFSWKTSRIRTVRNQLQINISHVKNTIFHEKQPEKSKWDHWLRFRSRITNISRIKFFTKTLLIHCS